jgi:hypothetical protein
LDLSGRDSLLLFLLLDGFLHRDTLLDAQFLQILFEV